MKRHATFITLTFILVGSFTGLAQRNLTNDPGYLDIDGSLNVEIARPQVNINLPKFLLNDALSEFDGSPDDPLAARGIEVGDLIKDIKLIRVMVIEAEDDNRRQIDMGVGTLRKELESKWTTVVSVPDDGVGIYAMSNDSGEGMAGLAILVQDDEDVVVANLVGRVSLGKVMKIAGKVNAIPPEVLEKLSSMSTNDSGSSETNQAKDDSKSDEE